MNRPLSTASGFGALATSLLSALVLGGCANNGASPGGNADAGQDAMPVEGGDEQLSCADGKEPCGQACVDLASDSNNCGACGKTCTADHFCKGAACVTCASGNRTSCNGVCADLLSDPANCGACATACASGQVCSRGVCVAACADGKSACGARCLDLTSDMQNCGECGHSCAAGQTCSAGACQCPNASQVACGASCISPGTDMLHCGATTGCGAGKGYVGTACAKSGYCQMGACQICQTWTQGWSITFPASEVYSWPPFFAMADFNGDARPDLAVGKRDAGTIVMLNGNGDGTFTSGPSFQISKTAWVIGKGDFNGDGKVDLVMGASAPNYLTVALGNGDGTFAAPIALAQQDRVLHIAVGDLNGDGFDDIVASGDSSYGGTYAEVFLSSATGNFAASTNYGPTLKSLFGSPGGVLTVVDADGDGKRDLVVGAAGVLFGNGDGTLGPSAWTRTGGNPGYPALLGDTNGDGHLDIVTPDVSLPNTLITSFGNANGNPRTWAAQPATRTLFPANATLADMTGGHALDLVGIGYIGGATLQVRLGRGDGTFVPGASFAFDPRPGGRFVVAELNGDAYPDVVGGTPTGLQVMLGGRANRPECP